MRVLKLTVEYDGTDYVGWQRQVNGTSVQGVLEAALEAFEAGPVTVHGAGRTDAGVHALGQVASVALSGVHAVMAVLRGLNSTLPRSIRVVGVEEADAGFHARYNAVAKVYEYRIVNAPVLSPFLARYTWHVPQPLDLDAMQRAAACLAGRHDFAAFQGAGSLIRDTVRTVESIEWQRGPAADAPMVLTVAADGFLRYMVRNIVGTLVEVGLGRKAVRHLPEILASRDRRLAGPTAPPQGLFLVRVDY